jgi:hypothetical protein
MARFCSDGAAASLAGLCWLGVNGYDSRALDNDYRFFSALADHKTRAAGDTQCPVADLVEQPWAHSLAVGLS